MSLLPAAVPVLCTPRLVLRALVDADAPALFAIFSDPATMRYWSTPPWRGPDEALRMIDGDRGHLGDGEAMRFGLFEHDGDVPIGCASLHHVDHGNRRAEIGYILDRSKRGRGLMHEAMTAVVDFAFEGLGLRRLEADLDPRNAGSIGVVERLGFVREGLLAERWLVGDEVSDSLIYGLLRSARAARGAGAGGDAGDDGRA